MSDVQRTKRCSRCHVEKSVAEFYPDNRVSSGGYVSRCRICFVEDARLFRLANKARLALAAKKRRAEDPIKTKEIAFRARVKNREKASATNAAWRAANPEKKRASLAAWYVANREKQKAYFAKYQKDHPEVHRKTLAKRRAAKAGVAIGDLQAIADWDASWRTKKSVICHWCGGKFPGNKCHADHVVPLAKGGPHALENLAVSCPTCNLRKKAKEPEEFNRTLNQPLLFV